MAYRFKAFQGYREGGGTVGESQLFQRLCPKLETLPLGFIFTMLGHVGGPLECTLVGHPHVLWPFGNLPSAIGGKPILASCIQSWASASFAELGTLLIAAVHPVRYKEHRPNRAPKPIQIA